MRLTLIVAVVCLLVLSGCSTPRVISAENSCKNPPTGDPTVVKVNIRKNPKADKKIEPVERICARPGDVLNFKVTVRGKNSRVEGKNPEDAWIKGGTAKRKASYWVLVPENILPDGVEEELFEYSIFLEDFDELDPEVQVRRRF